MELVSEKEAKELMSETREWASKHSMFSSATGTAAIAAAEFYLNSQGKTLYSHLAVQYKPIILDAGLIMKLAKESGFVQGPWANGNKERIWQENREFPDALEVFASLIAKECSNIIKERHKLALEQGWDVDDAMNDVKEQISSKFEVKE